MAEHTFETCPAKPRLEHLEQKDADQNGSMQRIEAKVDRLFFTILGGLGTVILALVAAILATR